MTTKEIANRFYELAQQGKWYEIQDELYSSDAQSIEPPHGDLPTVTGIDKIKEKGKIWEQMIEEVHHGYCNEPQVAGNYFTCTMGVDITTKNQGRMLNEEVALYHVKDGKIVSEQFFF